MAEENEAPQVVEPRFRGRIGSAVGTITDLFNTLATDLERFEKQVAALRKSIEDLRSKI